MPVASCVVRVALIRQILRAQLVECTLRLREVGEAHSLEHARRLGELDRAVVDELPAIPPRIPEVVTADELDRRLAKATHRILQVVDDQTDVPVRVGSVGARRCERDELVAEVEERHPARAPAQLDAVERSLEEGDGLVDVPDLDSDVVDAHQPSHVLTVPAIDIFLYKNIMRHVARAATTADAFNAVAEPRRRQILDVLADGERPVNDLVRMLGVAQPQVSKHLRVLREVGAVDVREDGRRRVYRLNGQALKPIHDWVKEYEETWSERFAQLDVVLDELKQKEEGDGGDE